MKIKVAVCVECEVEHGKDGCAHTFRANSKIICRDCGDGGDVVKVGGYIFCLRCVSRMAVELNLGS